MRDVWRPDRPQFPMSSFNVSTSLVYFSLKVPILLIFNIESPVKVNVYCLWVEYDHICFLPYIKGVSTFTFPMSTECTQFYFPKLLP